jgi:UDP-N-acetylglucosamine--N-acetylmuramyl-(pentapeptide) pyrophosphoryl-undecaprenol N-acetylglucosamine transferase
VTTLFVSTIGGHLDQLDALARRIPVDGPAVWVTHANGQSRALLAGRDAQFVPYVHERSLTDVARCVPTAHRLWREKSLTRAVSTGSGIALGFLPYLAAHGVSCHYIESAARVRGPSLTGRVLERVPGIRRYTQYAHWAGPRWQHRGSVFDDYQPIDGGAAYRRRPAGLVRVVVTLGTADEFPFTRLVERLVPLLSRDGALARATGLPVEVLWQTGCTPTAYLPIDALAFLPGEKLTAAVADADLVVSHAGVGSALTALAAGHRPVLADRVAERGEFRDDHQRQIAVELHRRGLAVHADASILTVDHLLAALSSGVRRAGDPPVFELAP